MKNLRIPIKDALIISFDVESTGTQALEDRIVQLALIYAKFTKQGFEEIKTYQSLINPLRPIPAEATKVHHITDEMVANAFTFSQVADRLYQHFRGLNTPTPAYPAENQTFVLCGYNALGFDVKIVNKEFERCGQLNVIDDSIPVLDPFLFVRYYYRHYKSNLQTICQYFEIDLLSAHHAKDDAKATAELLLKLIDAKIIPAQLQQALDLQKKIKTELDLAFERYGSWLYQDRTTGMLKLGASTHQGLPLEIVDLTHLEYILRVIRDLTPETRRCFEEEIQRRQSKK